MTTSGRQERNPRPRDGECAAQRLTAKPAGARHDLRPPSCDQLLGPTLGTPSRMGTEKGDSQHVHPVSSARTCGQDSGQERQSWESQSRRSALTSLHTPACTE